MGNEHGKPPPDQIQVVNTVADDKQDQKISAEPTRLDEPGAGEATLGPDIQRHLGRRLKALYSDLVDQPVPDRFQKLLDELERKEKSQ